MYCRACGHRQDASGEPCPRCGWQEGQPVPRPSPSVARCPSCGFHGQGVPYFRRSSHVFLLIGATLFTYGIGGLVYWLAKRNARICPDCGLDWSRAALAPATLGDGAPASRGSGEDGLPSDGGGRRVMGVALLLLAFLLVLLGWVEGGGEVYFPVSAALGGAGALTFWWGWSSKQSRREELLRRMQGKVLEMAAGRDGELTVTEVAQELRLSLTAAERILVSMEDGFRVRSDVTREGLLVFQFPELTARRPSALTSGPDDKAPAADLEGEPSE